MSKTRIALFLSVILNGFLITSVITHGGLGNAHSGPLPDRLIHTLTRNLSKNDAAQVIQTFQSRQAAYANLHDSWKENKEALNAILNVDPVNMESVKSILAKANNDHRRFDDLTEQALLQALPTLSTDGRHKLFNDEDHR